jgi:hypothetical protein
MGFWLPPEQMPNLKTKIDLCVSDGKRAARTMSLGRLTGEGQPRYSATSGIRNVVVAPVSRSIFVRNPRPFQERITGTIGILSSTLPHFARV